jgi:uncharacterized membrane protein
MPILCEIAKYQKEAEVILLGTGALILLLVILAALFHTSALTIEAKSPKSPIELLDEQFARGEIDKAEYIERIKATVNEEPLNS